MYVQLFPITYSLAQTIESCAEIKQFIETGTIYNCLHINAPQESMKAWQLRCRINYNKMRKKLTRYLERLRMQVCSFPVPFHKISCGVQHGHSSNRDF